MREIDLAWAAGFIDGEGSITIHRRGTKNHYIELSVSQSGDREPLIRLQTIFNTEAKIKKTKGSRKGFKYTWAQCSNKAVQILQELRPFSTVKKREIDLVLAFQNLPRGSRTTRLKLDEWDIAERDAYKEALSDWHQSPRTNEYA